MADIYQSPASGEEADDQTAGLEIDTPSESKGSRTALIPNEFFGGKEIAPGTECKVRIDRVLDGQVQVSYVEHNEEEPELGDDEPAGDSEMDSYMNE